MPFFLAAVGKPFSRPACLLAPFLGSSPTSPTIRNEAARVRCPTCPLLPPCTILQHTNAHVSPGRYSCWARESNLPQNCHLQKAAAVLLEEEGWSIQTNSTVSSIAANESFRDGQDENKKVPGGCIHHPSTPRRRSTSPSHRTSRRVVVWVITAFEPSEASSARYTIFFGAAAPSLLLLWYRRSRVRQKKRPRRADLTTLTNKNCTTLTNKNCIRSFLSTRPPSCYIPWAASFSAERLFRGKPKNST